ncbi:MAG: hypothetical protein EHM21_02595 [Chloroflexi bacterium]|nr:MAG: hypothetical protein EHM21_02595 [Chloroflexota bacterium]
MHGPFYLGIDGGQTSTLAVISDRQGNLCGVGNAGPSNHIHEPGGMERLRSALADSIGIASAAISLFENNPGHKPHFRAACCGMTGGVDYVPSLISDYAEIERLVTHVDIVTAQAGALAGQPGVVVIAGTGSIAYGVDATGRSARAGGWAYLFGDEGSAYDIGCQALTAAARMSDGRGPDTMLLARILEHFHAEQFWDVRTLVYSAGFERAQVAKLAPLACQVAKEGDQAAQEIFDRAGVSLGEIALAVLRKLEITADAQVACVGGVFNAGRLIIEPLTRFFEMRWPGVMVRTPVFAPVIGAILLALRADGVELDLNLLERLAQANRLLEKQ